MKTSGLKMNMKKMKKMKNKNINQTAAMNTAEIKKTLDKALQFCAHQYEEIANHTDCKYIQRDEKCLFVTPGIVAEYLLGREPKNEGERDKMQAIVDYLINKEWDSIKANGINVYYPYFTTKEKLSKQASITFDMFEMLKVKPVEPNSTLYKIYVTDLFLASLTTYFGPASHRVKKQMSAVKKEYDKHYQGRIRWDDDDKCCQRTFTWAYDN